MQASGASRNLGLLSWREGKTVTCHVACLSQGNFSWLSFNVVAWGARHSFGFENVAPVMASSSFVGFLVLLFEPVVVNHGFPSDRGSARSLWNAVPHCEEV